MPGVTGSRLENPTTGEVVWGDSSQVVSPKDEAQRKAGERTKAIFSRGLGGESVPDLLM